VRTARTALVVAGTKGVDSGGISRTSHRIDLRSGCMPNHQMVL
jgi:hypothetical protein